MRIPFFRQKPHEEAERYAEAQSLVDGGLDVEAVLGLYPEDAEWLRPLLDTSAVIGGTLKAEEPSFYFEASMKNRFLEAARMKQAGEFVPVAVGDELAAPGPGRMRWSTGIASGVVMAFLGLFGVATFGYATADDSVPGDWNYVFKQFGERVEYSLSSGDGRVDVQLDHTEERIREASKMARAGNLDEGAVGRLSDELNDLLELTEQHEFDDGQRARVKGLNESVVGLLGPRVTAPDATGAAGDEPPSAYEEAIDRANRVVAAADGNGVGTLPDPTPTATATATPEPTQTPQPTKTPVPTATPEPTPTPTPEPTEPPEPTETPTLPPNATPTATPTLPPNATPTPSPGNGGGVVPLEPVAE